MAKKDRKRRYSYNEYRLSVYVEKSFLCDSVISFSFDYDDKLPIVLFIGQPHYFYLHCYLLHLLSSSLFVGEEACPSRCTNF